MPPHERHPCARPDRSRPRAVRGAAAPLRRAGAALHLVPHGRPLRRGLRPAATCAMRCSSARRARWPAARCRCRCTCTSRSATRCATTAPATRSSPSTTSARPSTCDALDTEIELVVAPGPRRPAGVAAALRRRLADLPVRCRTAARGRLAAPRLPHRRRHRDVDRGRPAHRHARAAGASAARSASTASASACRTSTRRCRTPCTACSPSRACAS